MHKLLTHLVRVGKILAPVFETNVVQQMQVQTSPWEIRDSVNSLQMYGFASSPLPGADVVIVNLSGDNSNGQVIASNDQRHRPQYLAGGEVVVHDDSGQSIYISKTNGVLSIRISGGQQVNISAASSVNITAPTVAVTGNLTVSGTIRAQGNIFAGGVDLATHRHSGVQTGSGNTAGPFG